MKNSRNRGGGWLNIVKIDWQIFAICRWMKKEILKRKKEKRQGKKSIKKEVVKSEENDSRKKRMTERKENMGKER